MASGKTAAAAITVGRFFERARQRSVAGIVAAVDQQQIEADDAGFEARNFLDEAGQFGARQRVAAFLRGRIIVDGDDGEELGRGPFAAHEQAQIGQRALGAVEKPEIAVHMAVAQRDRPKCRQQQRNQRLKSPAGHCGSTAIIVRAAPAVRRRAVAPSV